MSKCRTWGLRWTTAALAIGAAVAGLAPAVAGSQGPARSSQGGDAALVNRGHDLFEEECSSCHGFAAGGVPNRGPSLRGVGAAATDFYLRTGRMPLSYPGEEPMRATPRYTDRQTEALVAYVASFGGPGVPTVRPQRGSLSEGQQLFVSHCAGCHAITAEGGVATGAAAPTLKDSTSTEVAEALRTGPYLMPRFNRRLIDRHEVDSLARYVASTQSPDDAGGWGIGHIGPVPEGMVAWFLAAAALLGVARLIGEARREGGEECARRRRSLDDCGDTWSPS
jgi:ubiquinol-cytochrome c reductase cytochrome c subunit